MPNRRESPCRTLLLSYWRSAIGGLALAAPFVGFATLVVWLLAGSSVGQTAISFGLRGLDEFDVAVGGDQTAQMFTLSDLNGDGNLDLITVNQDADGINVLMGTGEGTFEQPTVLEGQGVPTAVVVADVSAPFSENNGAPDGRLDIIAGYDDGVIQVFLGKGDGTFDPPDQDFEEFLDATSVFAIALGDFDQNGAPDIAVLDDIGDEVFFLCNRAGTFSLCPTESLETGGDIGIKILSGDFNGDSRTDIAVLNHDSRDVSVMLNNGGGNFREPTLIDVRTATEGAPVDFAAGDLDGNGTTDLVVTTDEGFSDETAFVLLGQRRGDFTRAPFSADVGSSIALADFD